MASECLSLANEVENAIRKYATFNHVITSYSIHYTKLYDSIASHSGLIGFSTQKLMWRHKAFYDSGKTPFEIV